jgi:hypothetical protein
VHLPYRKDMSLQGRRLESALPEPVEQEDWVTVFQIKDMDVSSFAYQQAISQITARTRRGRKNTRRDLWVLVSQEPSTAMGLDRSIF